MPAALIVLPSVESAPVDIPQTGRDLIQRILDDGASRWIGPTDVAALALAERLWDDAIVARGVWLAQPDNPKSYAAYEHLTKRLQDALTVLGLDPVARGRLGIAQVKAASKLEELRSQRAKRLQAGHRAG